MNVAKSKANLLKCQSSAFKKRHVIHRNTANMI